MRARATHALATTLAVLLLASAETSSAQDTTSLAAGVIYDGASVGVERGGLRRGATYVGNLHLKLTVTGDAFGWRGFSAFVDVLTVHGMRPSQRVGDAQGVSSIEGPSGTQVEELWLQQNVTGNRASVLVGLYDVNSEFYRLQAAGLFLNSALGIGAEFAQGGVEGPSIFPRTAAGARLAIKPSTGTVLRIALLDGVPLVRADGARALFKSGDGLLTVVEAAAITRPGSPEPRPTGRRDRIGRFSSLLPYGDKLAVGAWHFSGRFPALTATSSDVRSTARRGTSGAYMIGEHVLRGGDNDADARLAVFAHVGVADSRTNRFASHVATGLVGSGWGLIKRSDQIGVSFTAVGNGASYARLQSAQRINAARAEATVEFSYLSQLSTHVALQPDVQLVRRPNTDPAIRNAWVLQLHFELSP